MQLAAVDRDPWTILLPGIAHDLELSRDGLQLAGGGAANFYCEFFHVLFIPFDCVCLMALAA